MSAGATTDTARMARARAPVSAATALGRAAVVAVAAVLLAAALAPWTFAVAQRLPIVAQYPFRRVFDRTAMVVLVLGFALCWRWLQVRFAVRPLLRRRRAVGRSLAWFAIGAACIWLLVATQFGVGLRGFRHPELWRVLSAAVAALGSAICVALLEETVFRGFMLHALMDKLGRYRGILLTSAIFATLHLFTLDYFLTSIRDVAFDGTRWYEGFRLLALFFRPLASPLRVAPGLVGLFLAGWLLAELTARTRSLWPAIGLHAGWVWAIKTSGRVWKYYDPTPAGAGPAWLFGEKYAAAGLLGWLMVGALILLVNGMAAYVVYRGAQLLVTPLSQRAAAALGRTLGRCAYHLAVGRRRLAVRNIARAFPDRAPAEWRAIARGSFETLGIVALEFLRFHVIVRKFFDVVQPRGLDYIQQAAAEGAGIVFFTGHFGNWEIFPVGCGLLRYPFTGVARPHANEWIYRDVLRTRQATGVEILDKKHIAHDVLKRLRAGGMVGFVGDQYAGSQALFVEFFGELASTSAAMATFARKTGAAIIPAFDHINVDGTHTPIIHPPLRVARSENPADDIAAATQALMRILEQEIRAAPTMYVWAHRKWRPRRHTPGQGVPRMAVHCTPEAS